jgi:hypothetical protein
MDAGNREVWRLQATDVFSGRESAACAHQGLGLRAKMRISNGDVLAGHASSKVLKQARRWVEEHRAELSAMWDEFQR